MSANYLESQAALSEDASAEPRRAAVEADRADEVRGLRVLPTFRDPRRAGPARTGRRSGPAERTLRSRARCPDGTAVQNGELAAPAAEPHRGSGSRHLGCDGTAARRDATPHAQR